MDYQEIITKIKESDIAVEEFAHEDFSFPFSEKEFLEKNGIPNWKEIEQYGGEGQGDTWYSVKHFPEHNVYIKVEGYYQSYNGTEFHKGWDSCSEVKPVTKTITVYE